MNDEELLKVQKEKREMRESLENIIAGISSSETVMSITLRMLDESIRTAQDEKAKKRLTEIKDALILSRDRIQLEAKGLESIADILPRTMDNIAVKVEELRADMQKGK